MTYIHNNKRNKLDKKTKKQHLIISTIITPLLYKLTLDFIHQPITYHAIYNTIWDKMLEICPNQYALPDANQPLSANKCVKNCFKPISFIPSNHHINIKILNN